MSESCLISLALVVVFTALAFAVFGFVAFVQGTRQRRELRELRAEFGLLRRRIETGERPEPVTAPAPPAQPVTAPPVPQRVAAPPPPPPRAEQATNWATIEAAIGKRWMTYAGALVLFLAAAFFIKYAFDSGLVGPAARVLLGLVAGIALLVFGDRLDRKEMKIIGQGLIGLGLAVLVLSIFAAFSFYDLVAQELAFGGLVLVVALGMLLAVAHSALSIAFLAVLGGLLTPLLVSTGVDARDALFTYLLLLDVAVLGVAFFRRWRALDVLAFVGTLALYIGWFDQFYRDPGWLPAVAWLGAFFLVFLALPFVYHLRKGTVVPIERFIMALVNAVAMFGLAYVILEKDHGFVLGFVALAMGGCYLALGVLTRQRVGDDIKSLFGFVALAVGFLTIAVPLHLRLHGITLAWAVEAPVLVYLGYRYRYLPARLGAVAVLIVAVGRLFAVHWPLHHGVFMPFFNAPLASALSLVAAMAAVAVLHHRFREQGGRWDMAVRDGAIVVGGLLGLSVLQHETTAAVRQTTETIGESRRLAGPWASALWSLGAAGYAYFGMRRRHTATWIASLGFAAIGFLLAMHLYVEQWPQDVWFVANWRFVAAALALGAVAWFIALGRRDAEMAARLKTLLGVLTAVWLVLVWLTVSVEVLRVAHDTVADRAQGRWLGQLLLSLTWAVYAAVLLAVGFWRHGRALRLAALALFGVTCLKLVLLDMADLSALYRIVAFFVVGVLMIGASYGYHVVEQRLAKQEGDATS